MEDKVFLTEECFCLNFELQTLAEYLLFKRSERFVPGYMSGLLENDHTERYKLASEYTNGKIVLDIACGVGYGTKMLATEGKALKIIGGDIDKEAIRYAKHRAVADNLDFRIIDAQSIQLEEQVDIVTSFETIEHVPDFQKFLDSVSNILKPGGMFIVSTPIAQVKGVDLNPSNSYHTQEWGFEYFQEMLGEQFVIDKVYTQLYQLSFVNGDIHKKYLERRASMTLVQRIKSRYDKIIKGYTDLPQFINGWDVKENYSKLVEYHAGDIEDTSLLGVLHRGYQVVICKKRGEK